MRLITTKELRILHIATRHHHTINSRLAIVRYAEEYGFKGTARRFGLDRKTVRTWHRRWVASGPAGLVPRHPLKRRRRLAEETVQLIEQARRDLQFGAMRTRIWLDRVHRIRVATATIRRICRDLGYPPVRRTEPRRSRHPILFSTEHPGECVQIDVKEVKVAGQKCFQYTAIDDCTRYRVLRLYPRKYHGTSLDFFATVRQTLPFPIRKVQVDNVLHPEVKKPEQAHLSCGASWALKSASAFPPNGASISVRGAVDHSDTRSSKLAFTVLNTTGSPSGSSEYYLRGQCLPRRPARTECSTGWECLKVRPIVGSRLD